MPKKSKKNRIQAEQARLLALYDSLTPEKMALAIGMIERAAFMRVECEDLELDLQKKGWTEPFQQGNQEPYDRARPQGQTYQQLNGNYQKIIKLLDSLLPQPAPGAQQKDDGFDAFVNNRDEA